MRSLFGRITPSFPGTLGLLLGGLSLCGGVALAEEPIAPAETSSQPSTATRSSVQPPPRMRTLLGAMYQRPSYTARPSASP